jgi:hypothetical protein
LYYQKIKSTTAQQHNNFQQRLSSEASKLLFDVSRDNIVEARRLIQSQSSLEGGYPTGEGSLLVNQNSEIVSLSLHQLVWSGLVRGLAATAASCS